MNRIMLWVLDLVFNWLFSLVDKNRDGKISPEEIKDMINYLENNVKLLKQELKK